MGSIIFLAIGVVIVAIVLGAWGITTSSKAGDEALERDEHEISRGRQLGGR